MKKIIMMLAVAGLAAAAPAYAKPGNGNGNGHAKHGKQMKMKAQEANASDYAKRPRDRRTLAEIEGENRQKANWCPPGLAKKNNGCTPPGQIARVAKVGQKVPATARFAPMPQELIGQFPQRQGYDYNYNGTGAVYEIDRATRMITNVFTPDR